MKKLILTAVLMASALTAPLASAEGCHICGPDNAPLTIEEFADFHCKYCAKGAETMKRVRKEYPDKVRLVFRNLPLDFHGSGALNAAKAMIAVCMQSPAWAYSFQEELFKNQAELIKQGDQFLFDTAAKLGVDVAKMRLDMEGPEVASQIEEDKKAAEHHNFKGTPSFVIGDEEVSGALPYDEIKKIVERQLRNNRPI